MLNYLFINKMYVYAYRYYHDTCLNISYLVDVYCYPTN